LASYLPKAQEYIKKNIQVYKKNANLLKETLLSCGFDVIGGVDSPYIWVSTPERQECWQAFQFLLEKLNIITIPGAIFGSEGRYRLRISSLGTAKDCLEASAILKTYYEKDTQHPNIS